ncbi:MAG: UbiH/UbiF/VisC/COQ6 family ubiquinone biosynthesis hydroxylase [Porticoccaceae bacterium]|nr:UbiH/UbiF/VisC/COQ6 family ubiquinone biosynthesis hydroxylase [Porticoccaceae bacterium]
MVDKTNGQGARQYDVIVVGAGMVGAAFASLFAQANPELKLALIEAYQADSYSTEQFDPRVAALTEKSRSLLECCGAWQQIAEKRVSAYLAMDVWDAEGTGRIRFDAQDVHQPNLGHIVENSLVVESLLNKIQQLDNIEFLCPVRVASYSDSEQQVTLELDDGRLLSAPLLVAADGGNSAIRQQFNFPTREWDYGHSAIVTTVQTEQVNQQTAWQRFMPTGPLALLPLNKAGDQHYCSLVWSQESGEAERLMALDDTEFCQALSLGSEHCLGKVTAVDKRYSISLRQRHATDYVVERVALLGDSAHTIHPLAGQGVNLGFADVAALVETLSAAAKRGNDLGSLMTLNKYQRQRKPENLAMMAAMEGFKRLFAADNLAVRLLRNMGLSQVDKLKPVKNEIIKQVMGL